MRLPRMGLLFVISSFQPQALATLLPGESTDFDGHSESQYQKIYSWTIRHPLQAFEETASQLQANSWQINHHLPHSGVPQPFLDQIQPNIASLTQQAKPLFYKNFHDDGLASGKFHFDQKGNGIGFTFRGQFQPLPNVRNMEVALTALSRTKSKLLQLSSKPVIATFNSGMALEADLSELGNELAEANTEDSLAAMSMERLSWSRTFWMIAVGVAMMVIGVAVVNKSDVDVHKELGTFLMVAGVLNIIGGIAAFIMCKTHAWDTLCDGPYSVKHHPWNARRNIRPADGK